MIMTFEPKHSQMIVTFEPKHSPMNGLGLDHQSCGCVCVQLQMFYGLKDSFLLIALFHYTIQRIDIVLV